MDPPRNHAVGVGRQRRAFGPPRPGAEPPRALHQGPATTPCGSTGRRPCRERPCTSPWASGSCRASAVRRPSRSNARWPPDGRVARRHLRRAHELGGRGPHPCRCVIVVDRRWSRSSTSRARSGAHKALRPGTEHCPRAREEVRSVQGQGTWYSALRLSTQHSVRSTRYEVLALAVGDQLGQLRIGHPRELVPLRPRVDTELDLLALRRVVADILAISRQPAIIADGIRS